MNKYKFFIFETKESTISKLIDKKGKGIHHIAFEVEYIYEKIKRLKKEGCTMIHEFPKRGADINSLHFFIPRAVMGY